MERIAPLAKILAEANGIDWQHLRGTGQGGLIVEADILAHLARIMSGEEEPPATPVDAPPPDWTGEDLSASLITPGLPSADALRGAGVDSDITAFVAQARTAPPAPTPAAPPLEDDALDFELDDDGADLEPAPAAPAAFEPVAAAPAPAWNFNAPTPMTPPPPVAASAPAQPQPFPPAASAFSGPEPVRAEPVPVAAPAASAAEAGLSSGLGGLLSRLYQPAAPTPAPQPEFVQPAPVQPPVAQAPVLPEPLPTPAFQPPAAPEPRLPELPALPSFPLPGLNAEADLPAPVVETPTPVASLPEVELPVEEPQPVAVYEEQVEAPAFQPALSLDAEPVAPAPAPVADAAPAARSFGTYLRRDVNVSPVADLRGQLIQALGQDVPLALLVARAAQRHADTLGAGTVALQDLTAGEARTVRPGTLREALGALDTAFEGTPSLLVTDAGTLDLDDLHLGHTVTLSVGREQGGRAALSLSGDVDPVRAARFLADVAGALEAPIILVV